MDRFDRPTEVGNQFYQEHFLDSQAHDRPGFQFRIENNFQQLTLEEIHREKSLLLAHDSRSLTLPLGYICKPSERLCGSRSGSPPAPSRVVKDLTFNTEYSVSIHDHELAVIGTYVDERITPGFYYRVRRVETGEWLWGGAARCLLSVGMGYGKRITFRSDATAEPTDYYMYSDTEAQGFAFCAAVPEEELVQRRLSLCDGDGRVVASVLVKSVCSGERLVRAPHAADPGMTSELMCRLDCDLQLSARPGGVVPLEGATISCQLVGVAHLLRGGAGCAARIVRIYPVHVPHLPTEKFSIDCV